MRDSLPFTADFNLGKKHADPLLRLTESNFEGNSWIAFPAVKREVMCECERVYASIAFYILMLFISWIISNITHLYLCQTCGSCEYINRTVCVLAHVRLVCVLHACYITQYM